MPNRVLNSVNILYTPNIEDVKNYNNYASPNTFVVSSYLNSGTYFGFEYYKGLSYELYYIDPNKKINQLTYNIVKGNGLYIKDNKFEIKLDNDTLKTREYKGKYYTYVDSTSFKEASYLNRGLLSIKNDAYYNDRYEHTLNGDGAFSFNNNHQIILSNGLKQDLLNIQKYYNKCSNIIKTITELYKVCIKDLNVATFVEVGDILYYNSEKKIYTLNKTNKSGSINAPAMVCVIASNVLEDGEPRFMPLKRKMNQYIFDSSNTMYVKNALSTIPIYSTNDLTQIDISTNTISSNKGYIAVKRDEWKNNVHNPLNSSENYHVLNDKILVSSVQTDTFISKQNINWYIDATKINSNNNYIIEPNGIFTDIIDQTVQQYIGDSIIYMIITIVFNNNIVKYYLCNLRLKDNRLINLSYIYGYNLKKTITNNFSEASYNSNEYFNILSQKDIKEYSSTANESVSKKSSIIFTNLKNISTDFTEVSNTSKETFVISKESNILADTKIEISGIKHFNNTTHFFVQSSVKGQILLSVSDGVLDRSQIISNGPTTYYGDFITNNLHETVSVTIKANFIPDQLNKYKSSSASLQTIIPAKEQTKQVNNTIVNTVTTNTNNNNNNSTKTPTNSSIIYNNGNIVEWNSNKGSFWC